MNPWDADIQLSIDGARELVTGQFPDHGGDSFRILSSGWDNDAYLADENVVFRFPRRKVAASLVENEVRFLPLLAPHLPLPISVSRYVGVPSVDYPFIWAGYGFMEGTTACRVDWTEEQRAGNAEILGEFLKALHAIRIDPETKKWAPGDDLARTDMEARLPILLERLANLPNILPDIDAVLVERIARSLLRSEIADPRSEISCMCHGDLYSRHLLVNDQKEVNGVIDWGDVHLGDPAVDLSIAFTFLPAAAHDEFRAAYGEIDEGTWTRATFRAIYHATTIAEYGNGIGDADLLKAAQFCLESIARLQNI
jgi:aminoglycoside phosphotransferase (APT) family kinase protein